MNSATVSSQLRKIIKDILIENQPVVNQFKSGKDKALNALIGKVLAQAKSIGENPDALGITKVMKEIILSDDQQA